MSTLRPTLLRWYDAHARDLPWRRTRDPYRVWVSEVMLQQTRVETVLGYYAPFLRRFPSVRALAKAPEDDVMAVWSGLGYYRRARLLHRGAKEVVARHGGHLPDAVEALRALPGIGRYTAGAIASIAFDVAAPIVDGNVARVLARIHAIETPLGAPETERRLWAEAEALVDGPRPGAFNQALMELGATVCTPSLPDCDRCPWRAGCRAHAEGRTDALPIPRERRPPKPVALVALVATSARGERIWLARGDGTLYGALWNLPMREGRGRDDALALARDVLPGTRVESHATGAVEHVLTHRRLRVELWRGTAPSRRTSTALRAHRLRDLDALGVSTLTRHALARAGLTV